MFLNCQIRQYQRSRRYIRCTIIVATVGGIATHCDRRAMAQFLRWDIEATVIQIDEPQGVLNEVQRGDPVRGWLSFHLGILPNADSSSASYTHPATFQVSRMIIDNPRTGDEIVFEGSKDHSAYHNVDVYSDYLMAIDDVVPPLGLEAGLPVTSVKLTSPTDVFLDFSLPQQLELADWPQAILTYADLLGGAAVYAEIYSLTPVEVTFAAADFDFDGDVDADDLQVWALNFGMDGYPDADADFDYDADGHDFLVWQRQIDNGTNTDAAIPEPASLILAIVAAGSFLRIAKYVRRHVVQVGLRDQP